MLRAKSYFIWFRHADDSRRSARRLNDLIGKTAVVTDGYSGMKGIVLHHLELSDIVSIGAFPVRFIVSGRLRHILVKNAGIVATPLTRDLTVIESQIAANLHGNLLIDCSTIACPSRCK
ncbi:NAD(P)-dependent dehydrogenase (short-subunit alcohol dehydrogenase family) [Paenibacillus endophyticus]|uniref:NAD(P)-dependent dehydrogenase (Short-subunit alcohol dehydrogenase family) n=1 Tax=Paenibacillus endophyticus TaxID=1294268 RepID=A0A7W5GDV8_9BACL|nr:hypothetical protein [Paenibacillus endophyticus]MBB3155873.1 NAD(P)-dependent dehydrogenase (short-subunit alcohol dehydrogenase family) [Paenibacillus endophyticus]